MKFKGSGSQWGACVRMSPNHFYQSPHHFLRETQRLSWRKPFRWTFTHVEIHSWSVTVGCTVEAGGDLNGNSTHLTFECWVHSPHSRWQSTGKAFTLLLGFCFFLNRVLDILTHVMSLVCVLIGGQKKHCRLLIISFRNPFLLLEFKFLVLAIDCCIHEAAYKLWRLIIVHEG